MINSIKIISTDFINFILNHTDSSIWLELSMIAVLTDFIKKIKIIKILIFMWIIFAFMCKDYEIQQAKNIKKESEKCICGCK